MLCLGALTATVAAQENWQSILAEGNNDNYARACPDYKKYSTFIQYVSSIHTEDRHLLIMYKSTAFGRPNVSTISAPVDSLPDLQLTDRREGN
jgi:hypothetical protein